MTSIEFPTVVRPRPLPPVPPSKPRRPGGDGRDPRPGAVTTVARTRFDIFRASLFAAHLRVAAQTALVLAGVLALSIRY